MARPPALQSGARLGLRGRAGDLDQRHRAAAAAGWTYGLAGGRWWDFTLGCGRPILFATSRQLHAGRLAPLLGERRWPGCVSEAGRLVLRGTLEQRLERPDRLVNPFRGIANLSKPPGDRGQRKRLRRAGRHLLPPQRCGHAGVCQRTDGVGGSHRSVLGVLVVIEEDAVPFLLPPAAGCTLGGAAPDLARQRHGRAADLGKGPARLDPTVDVDASGPRRLGPADEPEVLENIARH